MDNNGSQVNNINGITGTINLSPLKQDSFTDLTNQVHQLPCCIKFNGPSDVSDYFKPKPTGIKVDGLEVKEANFRGRNLQGAIVPLPEGFSGFILGKKKSGKDTAKNGDSRGNSLEISSSENSWETVAKCGNMTFWNHDSLPSQDDACLRLFHWFTVAKALHEPLSTEELSSASVTTNQKS